MLRIGVAIRLGARPAEVMEWAAWEVAAVAAYCELELEQYGADGRAPRSGSARTTTTFRYTFGKKE